MKMAMTDNKELCPICLEYQDSFEKHHVVWQFVGGPDDPENILNICCSCHAILTRGNPVDITIYNRFCVSYQRAIHGLNFELRVYGKVGEITGVELLNDYLGWASIEKADERIRSRGLGDYQIYLAAIHRFINPNDINSINMNPVKFQNIYDKIICPIRNRTLV